MCGTCQTKKLKGASSGMNVDSFFSSTIPKSSCDVICCSPVLPISSIPFPSQIQLGGLCKCNELPDVCWQSLHAHGFLQRLAYILSYILWCTSAIRYKALTPEKNDSQLQKLEGTEYTWSNLVCMISKVGADASHGSHRVLAPMLKVSSGLKTVLEESISVAAHTIHVRM